jgi:hypothetical protein
MQPKKLAELISLRIMKCAKVMNQRQSDYHRNDDTLHNFKRTARIFDEQPEESWRGMTGKHLTSLLDAIDDIANGRDVDYKKLDDVMSDMHNYLYLLEGLFAERKERIDKCLTMGEFTSELD